MEADGIRNLAERHRGDGGVDLFLDLMRLAEAVDCLAENVRLRNIRDILANYEKKRECDLEAVLFVKTADHWDCGR